MSDKKLKLDRFRLVAEMDDGQVYAVNLDDEQQDSLHLALEEILEGKLKIHLESFGRIEQMCP